MKFVYIPQNVKSSHHTNDQPKPFGQIQCSSRDIVWNVWFYEIIRLIHDLYFLTFLKELIFSVLLTFSQKYLHHSVPYRVVYQIKVIILYSWIYALSAYTVRANKMNCFIRTRTHTQRVTNNVQNMLRQSVLLFCAVPTNQYVDALEE